MSILDNLAVFPPLVKPVWDETFSLKLPPNLQITSLSLQTTPNQLTISINSDILITYTGTVGSSTCEVTNGSETRQEKTCSFTAFQRDLNVIFDYTMLGIENLKLKLAETRELHSVLMLNEFGRRGQLIPIRITNLEISVFDKDNALQVIPFLDPTTLKKVHISNCLAPGEILSIENLVILDQWKNIADFKITGFKVLVPDYKRLLHIGNVELQVGKVKGDQLVIVHQAFLLTKSIKNFSIEYIEFEDEENRFRNILGDPHATTPTGNGWVFDDEDDLLEVTHEFGKVGKFCFTRL